MFLFERDNKIISQCLFSAVNTWGLGQLFWLDLISKYLIVLIVCNWYAYVENTYVEIKC